MKLHRKWLSLIAVAATVGTGAALAAETTAAGTDSTTSTSSTAADTGTATGTATGAATGRHRGAHHGPMLVGITLRAARQLNLTSEQQTTIKGILSAARAQHQQQQQAASGASVDFAALGNPGDAGYTSAIQSLKTRAAARLQSEMELQSQIYNVLTPAQKAQLPQVLATMKAQAAQRRAAWRQQHAGEAKGASGSD